VEEAFVATVLGNTKSQQYFPGLVLTSGEKPTPSLVASSPLRHICNVPSASVIFKCILEDVSCEGVQHRQRLCLDRINCVKMAAFQFYFQLGKQRKAGRVRDDSHVAFDLKFPGGKGSVRACVVLMQELVLLSSKFGAKSSNIFTHSP
jgi:hypothetical protein